MEGREGTDDDGGGKMGCSELLQRMEEMTERKEIRYIWDFLGFSVCFCAFV